MSLGTPRFREAHGEDGSFLLVGIVVNVTASTVAHTSPALTPGGCASTTLVSSRPRSAKDSAFPAIGRSAHLNFPDLAGCDDRWFYAFDSSFQSAVCIMLTRVSTDIRDSRISRQDFLRLSPRRWLSSSAHERQQRSGGRIVTIAANLLSLLLSAFQYFSFQLCLSSASARLSWPQP